MAQQGWIKIYRQIKECAIWEDIEPYDRRSAWIDIILAANHEDKEISFNGKLILVKRGSFITSELKLSERWKWSRHKVDNFLNSLKYQNMVEYFKDNKKTTITIVKYDDYQSDKEIEGHQKNIKRTTEGHQKDINKNDKNDKNIFSSESIEIRLVEFLFKHILDNNEKAKQPNFQNWAKQFDYILRVDKRDLEEVKSLIRFSQKDTFWCTNILSPLKLREKYDQLVVKMKNANIPKSNSSAKTAQSFDMTGY